MSVKVPYACAIKICHDGMLEDTNSLHSAQLQYWEQKNAEYSFDTSFGKPILLI